MSHVSQINAVKSETHRWAAELQQYMHVQAAYPPVRGLLDVEVMLVGGDILDQVPRTLLKGPVGHQICLTGADSV
jgi:hypothetical protein